MRTALLVLLALSGFLLAAPAASAEEVCNGQPLVDWYPCSAGFVVRVCGEDAIDNCRMI